MKSHKQYINHVKRIVIDPSEKHGKESFPKSHTLSQRDSGAERLTHSYSPLLANSLQKRKKTPVFSGFSYEDWSEGADQPL